MAVWLNCCMGMESDCTERSEGIEMKIKFLFRWLSWFIGVFYEPNRRHFYIFPIPMLGIRIAFRFRHKCSGWLDRKTSCQRPATITCLYGPDSNMFVRDALCDQCGDVGQCLTQADSRHVLIPKHLLHYFEED